MSRQCLRDEDQPFECFVQSWLNSGPQQAPLASLRSLHSDARALNVIILECEALLIYGHQMVFKGSFENTNEMQMVINSLMI